MSLWPYLRPVGPGHSCPSVVDPYAWGRLCEVGREVYSRTFARMWVQLVSRQFVFGYQRPSGYLALIGHPDIRVCRDGGSPNLFDGSVDEYGVDDLCYMIQLGKVDERRKEVWTAFRKKSQDSDRAERWGRWLDEEVRVACDDARARVRKAQLASRSSVARKYLAA